MSELDNFLQHWRQGDFSLDVGGFIYAEPKSTRSEDSYDVRYTTKNVKGFVVISQTCDIVRCTSGRDFVAGCPLIEIPTTEDFAAIIKGRRPYLTYIENTDENVFADLRRVMSVHKELLITWKHCSGFNSSNLRLRFAAALERKFGQFAFPDEFNQATKPFRDRVWNRYSSTESIPGKVYRSLLQIRYKANPDWNSEERKIQIIAIMNNGSNREVDRSTIENELNQQINKMVLPYGYEWDTPSLLLGTAVELDAEDVISSERGDFDFLCY